MTNYLLLFVVGLVLALALTPPVRGLALRVGAVDQPGERKIHTAPVPRLGGLAIFGAFHLGLLLGFVPLFGLAYHLRESAHQWFLHLFPSVLAILLVGVWDDIRPLRPAVKFLGQLVAASLAIAGGCVIRLVEVPWVGTVALGAWAVPATLLWILALTNAFNLIDGLDGLACGIGLISTGTLAAVAVLRQDSALALVCALLAGTLTGFLRHNFHPARIFMGDSGSQFLGFALALLSVTASHKSTAAMSVLVPLLAFGLPLLDTVLSVLRRSLREGGAVFQADRDHIHHRLLQLGFSHPRAVLVLYAVSLVPAVLTLAVVAQRNPHFGLIFLVVGVVTMTAVRRLRYRELEFLRNGALLELSRKPLLTCEVFQAPVDLLLVALALYLAAVLVHGRVLTPEVKESLRGTVALIVLSKFLVLRLNGIYQTRWQYAGLADLLRGVRAVVLGSVVTTLVLWLVGQSGFTASLVALDLYLCATFLLGLRMSLRLLEHYVETDPTGKERVLIYGTGDTADLLIRYLLAEGKRAPVGFLHDSEPRGKTIYGIPILGPLDALSDVARQHRVTQLIVANPDLAAQQRDALLARCQEAGVELQQFYVTVESVK